MFGSQIVIIVISRHLRLLRPHRGKPVIFSINNHPTNKVIIHSYWNQPKNSPQSSEIPWFFEVHLRICCQLKLVRAFGVCCQTFPTPHKQKKFNPISKKKQNHSCVLTGKSSTINETTTKNTSIENLSWLTSHISSSHPIPQQPAFPAFPQLLRGHTLQGVGQVKESQPREAEESMGASGHNK